MNKKNILKNIMYEIDLKINWLVWCFILKEVLPFSVGLVSRGELTKEQYEFPETEEGKKLFNEFMKNYKSEESN